MHQSDFWKRTTASAMVPAFERRSHIALVDRLRHAAKPGWLFWHNANGEYRTWKTGALLKRMGVLPGVADFTLVSGTGEHHYLELKRGTSALTDSQIMFLTNMRERGIKCAVARSYDAAVKQLQEWGAL